MCVITYAKHQRKLCKNLIRAYTVVMQMMLHKSSLEKCNATCLEWTSYMPISTTHVFLLSIAVSIGKTCSVQGFFNEINNLKYFHSFELFIPLKNP